MRPIPAETEHDRFPTWTRRGCASAAATAASIAMLAIGAKKDLRDIFFTSLPLPSPKLTTRTRFTRLQTKTTGTKSGKANLRPLSLKQSRLCLLPFVLKHHLEYQTSECAGLF